MNVKVGIYARLSEEDRNKLNAEDDSNSIKNQKSMLLQYALEQGWEVYNVYSDDDYTGSDRSRPEFNRLLEDAKNHKFDIVLCKTQSRFTRELELVEKYIHGLFPMWGIRFVSIVDNADTDNKGNKKSRQINGLVNEWYLEDMSENIRSVLTNRRENGYHIGAFALYGYKKDPDQKGHLIIDEEAASVVREVFTLYAQGYGKTAIARMLNDRGIPNPTEYKRIHGLRYSPPKTKTGTLWKYYAISDMLVNEIYIGNMVQGKYGSVSYKSKVNKPRPKESWIVVKNTHEPIIDMDLWDKVQAIIKERAKPFDTGDVGLFAKKTRCASCGYVLRSLKTAPQRGGEHYLRCTTRYMSSELCEGACISVKRLEQMVIDELHRLAEEYLDEQKLEQEIKVCDKFASARKKIEADMKSYEKKIDECAKCLRELYVDKIKGVIDESMFMDMSKSFAAEKERVELLVADCKEKLNDIDKRVKAGRNRKAIIEQYKNIDHLTREMVVTLIDYISVGKRIQGTRNVPIEIHWNF